MAYTFYPLLLDSSNKQIAEQPRAYRSLTERHIQIVWLEQRLKKALKTEDGSEVEVISPGIWNFCAGPDFLNAHLKIGKIEYRGDVEIHLTEESWWKHGHHLDKRYSDVVLHLFLWPEKELSHRDKPGFSANYRISLLSYLIEPLEQLVEQIDLELYPFQPRSEPGRCAKELFSKLPEQQVKELFQEASYWRLSLKRKALMEQSGEYNRAALLGSVEALGYPKNAHTFRQLLQILTEDLSLSEEQLVAKGLERMGYFNEPYLTRWGEHLYYQKLMSYRDGKERDFVNLSFDHTQVRPQSHPVRRIALVAKWLKEPHIYHTLFEQVEKMWKNSWKALDGCKGERQLWKRLRELFIEPNGSHWNHHYTFENRSREKKLRLMGDELFQRILLNVLIPLLEGKLIERESIAELEACHRFYHSLKSISSSKRDYLQHRLLSFKRGEQLLKHADIEQGALQLHRDFCLHYETSCEGCPFINRYYNIRGG